MKTKRIILITLAICLLAFFALFKFTDMKTEIRETQSTVNLPIETAQSVLLKITENKAGWSIAGEELPARSQTREFNASIEDRVYEGLTSKGDESTRCVLKVSDISADTVTVTLLEDGQETTREIQYNNVYEYTAFTNPDEYSYKYSIEFKKQEFSPKEGKFQTVEESKL